MPRKTYAHPLVQDLYDHTAVHTRLSNKFHSMAGRRRAIAFWTKIRLWALWGTVEYLYERCVELGLADAAQEAEYQAQADNGDDWDRVLRGFFRGSDGNE